LQQTPWAQKFDRHSDAAEHDPPAGFLPHELLVQTRGDWQLVLSEQALKHAEPLHMYGVQGREVGAVQTPLAPHVEGGV
jgi:hypothetical protein